MRILHDFKYERPNSLDEALALLELHGKNAHTLAGGTDLVVNMKHRSMLQLVDGAGSNSAKFPTASRVPAILRPEVVVSLSELGELKGITTKTSAGTSGALHVGATTTMTEITSSENIPPALGALQDAAGVLGSPLVRNLATVGGNIITARPAADVAVAVLALGARFELASAKDRRRVDACDFFTGAGESVKRANELLLTIELPYDANEGSAYLRQGTRKQLEIAVASAAAWVRIDPESGTLSGARISLGSVAATPMCAGEAASNLTGKSPTPENLAAAAAAARSEARPIDDFRGSAEYRSQIIEVLVRRALETAVSRARAEGVG